MVPSAVRDLCGRAFGRRGLLTLATLGLPTGGFWRPARAGAPTAFDIRAFGAVGDGRAIDTPAVNRAIEAASGAGGGTVHVPAGTYVCASIRLKSFVALYLDPGATIVAAPLGSFDAAEPDPPWAAFQDFGHNHWHNSLIWGDGIHDVAILGSGLIWGRGLSRGEAAEPGLGSAKAPGAANKTIALKNCRNVVLRDFSILAGGHFGILATGTDNLTIDNLKIDTNRDGMNIDACRNVHISNCSVNSPTDDGICLKSSFALGEPRPTENVTITNCYVTGGYQVGSVLDGSRKRMTDPSLGTGRIKLGTESNGGFRNIAISNCVFESSRGFALETVDGGLAEDITFVGVTMRDLRNAPFFLRLGARMRGPVGAPVGQLRRVIISDVTCYGPANSMPAMISGIAGHPVEDISIRDVYLVQKGGDPAKLASIIPPEETSLYPEPFFFAPLPAQGLFMRHARNIEISHLEVACEAPDARPVFWIDDVADVRFSDIRLPSAATAPAFLLQRTRAFRVSATPPLADITIAGVNHKVLP